MSRDDDLLDREYSTYVVPHICTTGEPCYLAYHPELEGCMSHGDTKEEALDNLREARELYISVLLEKGQEIPVPQGQTVTWSVISQTSVDRADTDRPVSVALAAIS